MPRTAIDVTAAVLVVRDRVLAARRPAGASRGGLWELPGGKQEPGESLAQCLVRELAEELGLEVEVDGPFLTAAHDYPDIRVRLHALRCRWIGGQLRPAVHDRVRWLSSDELDQVQWSAADLPVIDRLRQELGARPTPRTRPGRT